MITHKSKSAPSLRLQPNTFENNTELFEIRLKDNFSVLANDRGFGFASFVTPCIQEDIFLPERLVKWLLAMDILSPRAYA